MRIVDLFSGAGGLTFGFYYKLIDNQFIKNANCEIVFANEYDEAAANAFGLNFPDVKLLNKDIRDISKDEIKDIIKTKPIDLIIGGPPCQSYTTIGKRVYDDKAKLYNEYYRMLSIIKPKMFLFENVKGMLSMKDDNGNLIVSDIKEKFEEIGYATTFKTLNAVDFGVPQYRERVFIIGIKKDLPISWNFDCLKTDNKEITIEEAISDLPVIGSGQCINNYGTSNPKNAYQKLMRGKTQALTCHFLPTYGNKIQTIMNHVVQGAGKDYINKLVDEGIIDERYRLTSGYKNTYGRLIANKPCTTITNNMSTPSALRCIHYEQNRALTPREGARIQSFPDWFQFAGMNVEIKKQIGNAVPPLLAIKIAEQLERILD